MRPPNASLSQPPTGIDLLVLPGMHLLDLAGPAQVFAHRSVAWPLRVIGPDANTTTAQGLAFGAIAPLPRSIEAGRWLIAIGSTNMPALLATATGARTADWLATHAERWARVGAVCAGALMLARAGLLDGYLATTHHSLLAELRRAAPHATVEDDTLFVDDRGRCTSAGLSSATDLALHLVQDTLGDAVADTVARDLMIYRRPQVSQTPLADTLQCRHHPDQRVHAVQDRIAEDLAVCGGLAALAEAVHLSERQLRRRFLCATGRTVRDYIQLARLERSAQLLRETNLPIDQVAEHAGFRDARALQRLWHRNHGTTPSAVRNRMA
ncbi:MAG: helix-turn-helix domain-containing protein [Pseudomonadota bacterium]